MAKLLIAGGGTGGHVLAGIAIADAWRAEFKEAGSTLFVGARGGMEERLVPKSGYPLKLLTLGSLNRVSWTRRVKTIFQVPIAFVRSFWILMTFRPQFVVGVGGYASGPVVLIAKVLSVLRLIRCKVTILEQNSVPGFTNRILGRLADEIFVAFPGMESRFPGKPVLVTGNPIRSSMKPMPSAGRDPFTLFIFGGSQGAIGINTLVLAALPYLTDLKPHLRFIHQTGEKDYQRVKEGYEKAGVQAQIEKFITDMPAIYGKASLLICRSGSSTLAEVAAVGRAALLIPLPTAADNHQEKNARVFSEAGASCLLLQQNATGEDLAKQIRELFVNPQRLTEMEKKVADFFRPTAAQDLVKGLAGFLSL